MGKVIAKKVSGMNIWTKVALITMCTLLVSVFMYEGWYKPKFAAAAIALRGTPTTATGTSASLTINKPTGTVQGDVMIANIAWSTGSTSNTNPPALTGWTLLTNQDSGSTSTYRRGATLYKVAGASEPSSYTFTIAGSATAWIVTGAISSFSGVNTTTPVEVTGTHQWNASSTTITAPSITTLTNNAVVLFCAQFGAQATTSNWTTATSGTMTEIYDAGTVAMGVAAATLTDPTAGSTGNGTATLSASARNGGVLLSLKPTAGNTTTLGNGVAGTTGTVCPGNTSQKLDGFSFVTSAGTDSITGLTVTTTGTTAIASVSIWNEAGTTQYFSTVTTPSGNNWVFSGGTAIPVSTTAQNYKILVSYDPHGTAPSGNTATTASVTAFTSGSGNTIAGTDTADTTLTLDNTPATSATWGTNSAGSSVTLNWTLGTTGDSVMIARYTTNTDTTMPTDGTTYTAASAFGTGGTVVYVGTGTTFTETPAAGTYYYRIFEYEGCQNYATIAPWSAAQVVTSGVPATTTGAMSFSAVTSSSVSVQVAFTGDTNNNNTCTIKYGTTLGTYPNTLTSTKGTGVYTATASGLTAGTTYYFQATFADADTVSGTNPVLGSQATTAAVNNTTTGAMSFTSVGTTSLTVQVAFTGDTNNNNSCVIKWGTVSGTYPNTAPAPTKGSGTYTTTVTGLTANTTYYFQATFTDADGVVSTNPVLGSQLTAGAWANSKLLHNSQNLGTKYGTWGVPGGRFGAFDCTTCHTENTTNIKRVAATLTAPYGNWSTSKTSTLSVKFTNLTGFGREAELRNSSTRICEACHSKTTVHSYKTATATWTHNGNVDCTGCHFHNAAFAGAGDCVTCHSNQQNTYRRKVAGTGGDIDNGITSHHIKYTALSPNDCTMCHDQANHKTYSNGVSVYLKNQDGGASVLYDGTTANNGKAACLSCHDANGASSLGANALKPFTASGDNTAPTNINWPATGGAHDTLMACFNCHGKSAAANTTLDPTYNGHGSPTAKLLQDTNYSFTAPNNYCFNCHDSASTDANKSSKNIKGQFNLTYKHVTPDCIDCHGDPTAANGVPSVHELKAGNHTTGSATIANNLANATGTSATWSAASAWPSTSNATFTNVNPATAEWHVCFRCHAGTGFAAGGTGAASMTDLALEFNPNNQSYHPVAQALPSTGNRRLASTALTGGWTPGMVMACSDCHGTDQASSYGPHGSSVKWMLDPNTTGTKYYNWPYTTAAGNGTSTGTLVNGTGSSTAPAGGIFCLSCHVWSGGGAAHTQQGSTHGKACVGCHIRVPHGGKALRLLTGPNAPGRYKPDGNAGGTIYLNGGSRPASGTMGTSNCQTGSGCTAHSASGTLLGW